MRQKTSHNRVYVLAAAVLLMLGLAFAAHTSASATADVPTLIGQAEGPADSFTFYILNDTRNEANEVEVASCQYFPGAIEAIRDLDGGGAFTVSPGDLDPLPLTYHVITTVLGSGYHWFPGVGNHEFPGEGTENHPGANIAWLQDFNYDIGGPGLSPNLVNSGPAGCPTTTYSFDHGAAHFVMLNVYCDVDGEVVSYGDIPDHVYTWLAADLEATDQPFIFVFGHEPAYPQRDAENGRIRHAHNSLNEFVEHRDRFWALLAEHDVTAYFSGHTHCYSAVRIDGVWQITTGHAAGIAETGMRSTFVRVSVADASVSYETYRQRPDDPCAYELTDAWANETAGRNVVPTPVVTPTPPPRGLFAETDLPRVAAGLGLSLLTLALLLGTILVIIIAVRANRQGSERRPPEA